MCYKQAVPKIVDPEQRRHELGEAALRVIHRDGIHGASLRNVAKEAGMSMGALRHYFDSQAEMLMFSSRPRIPSWIFRSGSRTLHVPDW